MGLSFLIWSVIYSVFVQLVSNRNFRVTVSLMRPKLNLSVEIGRALNPLGVCCTSGCTVKSIEALVSLPSAPARAIVKGLVRGQQQQ
jgi:hypothetical protein